MAGFMEQLVDWRAFESFVRDLYASHPELRVEHDVTAAGRSGAKRQIDVRFTHHAGGHTYVTLVECKRWKEPVSRDRIDVLAAAMRDLGASKGVMFTTSGYEAGAEAYAESEGIELFVVRDLTDDEWGRPGRVVWFWLQYYGAQIGEMSSGPVQFMVYGNAPPTLNLQLALGPNVDPDPAHTLYSVSDGKPGPNLVTLLLEARVRVLQIIAREQQGLIDEGAEGVVRAYTVPVRLNLGAYEFRELRQDFGAGRLEQFSMELLVTITQSRFEQDRGSNLDLAIAVENFMTRQRQVVIRGAQGDGVSRFELGEEAAETEDEDVLENGTIMPVFFEPWVHAPELSQPPQRAASVEFSLPDWTAMASHDASGE